MQILNALTLLPTRMAFSPDGRYFVAGDDRWLNLWDLAGSSSPLWYRVRPLSRGFVFAADGTSIVGGYPRSFQRYDVRTAKEIYDPFLGALNPDRFSPDGRFAFAAKLDENPRVLRLRCARAAGGGGSEAWQKDVPFNQEYGSFRYSLLQFSADGGRFVCVCARGQSARGKPLTDAEAFDAETGERVAGWSGELPLFMTGGAASGSGALVLLRGRALFAIDTNRRDGPAVKRLNATPKHFTHLAFSRDGGRLATASNDTTATIWDATTWEPRRRYEWNIGRLRTVCFAPDGLRCAAGSDSGRIVVWDLDD